MERISLHAAAAGMGLAAALLAGGAAAEPPSTESGPATSGASEFAARFRPVRPGDSGAEGAHSFSVSLYEVTNAEFVRFLNSAEANPTNRLGTNVFFDAQGNAWISPARVPGRDELFSIANSRLLYEPRETPGRRYRITMRTPAFGNSFSNHPASGVSWYGTAKYCNWLSLQAGLGVNQLAFREGTNTWDWAPATASPTNWLKGRFTAGERAAWVKRRGYRLPLGAEGGQGSRERGLDEFWRAAAWNGRTNTLYGFGRSVATPRDANYLDGSAARPGDTTPVGYFDGARKPDGFQSNTNANRYGAFDLSGNVEEWTVDPSSTNAMGVRAVRGGSWKEALPTVSESRFAAPHATDTARGFRVVTSHDFASGGGGLGAGGGWDDCEEYGGRFDPVRSGGVFDAVPGAGEVYLHLRRPELDEGEAGTTYTVDGRDYSATNLSPDLVIRIGIEGSSFGWQERFAADDGRLEELGIEPVSTDPRHWIAEVPAPRRAELRDVFPGVHFTMHDDSELWEYELTAEPGADWSNIVVTVDGTQAPHLEANGDLVYLLECGRLVFGKPYIYQSRDRITRFESYRGAYRPEGGGYAYDFTPLAAAAARSYDGAAARSGPQMRIVTPAGDTNGVPYTFHVSAFEVRNDEFCDFLNSAEANATNRLGANVHIDKQGSAWIHPAMASGRDEVFSIAESRLVYDPAQKPGRRYRVTDRRPQFGNSYSNHPITGVSWYGAVKYCNWLSLVTGRPESDLAYREGTNTWDWAPVTCAETNWVQGRFLSEERAAWLQVTGFRLPMDDRSGTNRHATAFDEFQQVATWNGRTNVLYGYGRNTLSANDANYYMASTLLRPDTRPVGFYDGSQQAGTFQTHTNENLYGAYDFSGNVEEWLTEAGVTNSLLLRGVRGGSWQQGLPTVSHRRLARPAETHTARGFRVATTYRADRDMVIVRVPYHICLCGYGRRVGKEGTEEEKKRDDELLDRGELTELKVDTTTTPGIPSGVIAEEEGEVETTPEPGEEVVTGEPGPSEGGVVTIPEEITPGEVSAGGI